MVHEEEVGTGRRVGVSGSLASTQLPAAVSSAVYNADNQLTQWGSTAITYDFNGNTLNDGTNSYSWDARNRLVSANNSGVSFAYDPLGRRVSKTISSTTTSFLYDGVDAVQKFGTNPTANLLTGGVDERFTRASATETDNYLTDLAVPTARPAFQPFARGGRTAFSPSRLTLPARLTRLAGRVPHDLSYISIGCRFFGRCFVPVGGFGVRWGPGSILRRQSQPESEFVFAARPAGEGAVAGRSGRTDRFAHQFGAGLPDGRGAERLRL
jgi:YD repeat-containing protein